MNCIPFEYASISRAARFFGCEVDDFFHWNEIGLIRIAMDLDDFEGTLLSVNDQRFELPPEFTTFYDVDGADIRYRDDLSSFVCEYTKIDDLHNVGRIYGTATGAWVPSAEVIRHLRTHSQFRSGFSASPYRSEGYYRVMIEIKPHHPSVGYSFEDLKTRWCPEILATDLRIYKDDLLKVSALLSGNDIATVKNANTEVEEPMVREHASQFSVICRLLQMIGLTDDEIYKSSPAKLQLTLEQKASLMNIAFPKIDKNTWARWRDKFPK